MSSKNITLKIDETILRQCRYAAIKENKSLSKWVADSISRTVSKKRQYNMARKSALKRLNKGFNLTGLPLRRDDIYERK